MNIGLLDVDGHNWPNLPLMKISAYHKARGDTVEPWWPMGHYERVYMSKVFDETYSPDIPEPLNADLIIKGGTGYVRREMDGTRRVFYNGCWVPEWMAYEKGIVYQETLPARIEHIYPDYSIYPAFTKETAYGFLTRGCPRHCSFCLVSAKEGTMSRRVADLSEFWRGQKRIKLLDANILACPDHLALLGQLAESGALVDFTQGLDARLLTERNIAVLREIRLDLLHFAWDTMEETDGVLRGLHLWAEKGKKCRTGRAGDVYVLTNHGTTMGENLFRVYTLRDMGYTPYIMIFDKPNAPPELRHLQRWCNSPRIFYSVPTFDQYKTTYGRRKH